MAIPAIFGAVAREAAKVASKTIGAASKEILGTSRTKTVSDEIYNAKRRAKRQADRFEQAVSWLENPAQKASKEARKLAGQFTKKELEETAKAYRELQQQFSANAKVQDLERVLQKARSENVMAESLRRQRNITQRDRTTWERLERSNSTSDVIWSFVNKELQRETGDTLGRRATIEDLRRIGGSDDVEQAIKNIFEERFGMTWEEGLRFDSKNEGPTELYELLQYSITTGKPPSAKKYKKVSQSGWYSSPKAKAKGKRRKK